MDEQPAVDFFIAHASADREYAERLYALLATRSRPFLDSRSLALGQPWDDQLQAALGRARVTVVLVSPHADQAYYLREEIAQAIDRAWQGSHQVVPVFLGGQAPPIYGLTRLQGIMVQPGTSVEDVAERLLRLLAGAAGRRRGSQARPGS